MKKIVCMLMVTAMAMAPAVVSAQESATTLAGLKAVLDKQDQILRSLEEIKAELAIVKVRATQR